jgi:peroxiredoxin
MEHDRFSSTASANALSVGDVAPAFELRQTFVRSISRTPGKPIVVAFYVFDFGDF